MSFLSPYMLWGTLAVSIPIALHFFFRSRYRTVPWAAMKFLLTSIEQVSRRLRFQELLLLILRCAVLLLLALALARPLSSSSGGVSGRGEAVDAVFVLDTSFSMGARDGNETRFERARKAALDILDKLPPHSTVQIVTCADRASLLGPRNPTNLDQAREILTRVQLTHLATDLLPGVTEALGVLKRGQLPNKEFYLFSDMQLLGWDQQGDALVKMMKEIGQQAAIYLVRCGSRKLSNVAIVEITPQAGIPRPGERVDFAILVRNTSSEPLRDLQVSLTVDGKSEERETQTIKELLPGATRAVSLTGKMGSAGLHVVTATVKQDDLEADNRLDQVILVRDQVQVLVVDGAPNAQDPTKASSFFLMHALVPVSDADLPKYYLQPHMVTPARATPELLEGKQLCILVNVALTPDKRRRVEVPSAEFLDQLVHFVRTGNGLMIFAGDNVTAEAYNRHLGEQRRLLPFKLRGLVEYPVKNPARLSRESAVMPGFRLFRDDEYFKGVNLVETWQHLDIDPASLSAERTKASPAGSAPEVQTKKDPALETTQIVLRYTNGKPALISGKVDAGELLFFTTAAHPGLRPETGDFAWTNWPILPTFMPLMHLSINHLMNSQTQSHNAVAGTALVWQAPPKEISRSFILLTPDGSKRRLGLPEMTQGRAVVNIDQLPMAGIYRLVSTDSAGGAVEPLDDPVVIEDLKKGRARVGRPIAVVPDLRESVDLQQIPTEQIDQRLGFKVTHVMAGADPTGLSAADRTNREWTRWLLLAVLVLAVGEMVLAWFCGRAW